MSSCTTGVMCYEKSKIIICPEKSVLQLFHFHHGSFFGSIYLLYLFIHADLLQEIIKEDEVLSAPLPRPPPPPPGHRAPPNCPPPSKPVLVPRGTASKVGILLGGAMLCDDFVLFWSSNGFICYSECWQRLGAKAVRCFYQLWAACLLILAEVFAHAFGPGLI